MAGFDNIANMIPVLAAGFSKNPNTVMNAINMSRAGRQDQEESSLREFGRILFSSGKMPESEAEIMEAAKMAGVRDFTKVMPMIGNYMKYRQENEAFARSKERPFEITDENGNVRRVMVNPDEAPENAVPGQTAYREPLINLYDPELGEYRVGTQRPGVELGGVPVAAHLASENRKFQGEQNALARSAADARAARADASRMAAASMNGAKQYKPELFINPQTGQSAWVSPGGEIPEGFQKDRSSMSLTTDKDGNVSFNTGGSGLAGGVRKKMERSTKSSLEKDIIRGEDSLSKLNAISRMVPRAKEFLTYKGKGKKWLLSKGAKINPDMVGPENEQYIRDARTFKNGVEQFFNQYRKEITGAAAPMAELKMLKDSMLNFDMDPIEFEAAHDQMTDTVRRSLRLRNKFLRDGIGDKNIGAAISDAYQNGADDSVQTRGEELEVSGLDEGQVLQRLIDEGYIKAE